MGDTPFCKYWRAVGTMKAEIHHRAYENHVKWMLTVGTMTSENGHRAYKSEDFYRHDGDLKRLQCLRPKI